jgi:hypothetical protein
MTCAQDRLAEGFRIPATKGVKKVDLNCGSIPTKLPTYTPLVGLVQLASDNPPAAAGGLILGDRQPRHAGIKYTSFGGPSMQTKKTVYVVLVAY